MSKESNIMVESQSSLSPDPILQIATGFWLSKTLMAAVELELFTKISGKRVTFGELKKILEMEDRPAEVFVTAVTSIGLLEQKKDEANRQVVFTNSKLAEEFLVKGKSTYVGDYTAMLDKHLYKRWDNLVQSLKANRPQDKAGDHSVNTLYDRAISNQYDEDFKAFTHSMYSVSIAPAIALTQIFDFSPYHKMIDIGAGPGTFAIQVVKNFPNMSATVIDSEPVCKIAAGYIKRFGLEDRIETKSMNFMSDEQPLPSDCDVAFLSHIVHGFGLEKNIQLLTKIYHSLPSGSIIIISEWLLDEEKTGPIPSAMMSMNMILEMNEGRNYSYGEIASMLQKAGFESIEMRQLSGPAQIVIGHKK